MGLVIMKENPKRNKATINATISPYLKRKLEVLADTDEFSSLSDVIAVACHEFLARYEANKECEISLSSVVQ